jgi:phage tail-like protein
MATFPWESGEKKGNDNKIGMSPRFCVEMDASIVASFSECSGLSVTIRNDKYEEGGRNSTTLKFPGRPDYSNITLKHGVTDTYDLFNWFLKVMRGEKARKEITLKLLTPMLVELQSWQLSRAFPVKWTAPMLQTTSNTVAIESLEIAFDGFVSLADRHKKS